MRTDVARPVHLSEYRPPDNLIDTVELDVLLHTTATRVRSKLRLRPNPKGRPGAPLVLDGDELQLVAAKLDGVALDVAAIASPNRLTIATPPARAFELVIDTTINPTGNTQLSGLYRTGSAYSTQCEAEGFRRITYFLDRPDVLAVYTTRIEAEKSEAAVLLGNGNRVEAGDIPGTSRHFAVWHDPHPKPAYLFALVGGNLGAIHDDFTTMSGRKVKLGIYVEHGKEPRAAYAMDALKRSMIWDEQKFGREYDLDVFNIVAVSDFNMGAMENKGLNIFNDKYVLASQETATDLDYAHIEAVIAHEYFHNWTGNRITCRDWFQLCLKEGLTVFRDQEFSSDQRSRPVKRIADVRGLRAAQFPEDNGPLAHNVRPSTYLEINNFYTSTVYQKGAEVIRMLKCLIGEEAFRRGMDLYFERYDGTAAIVEEFISCFAESSGRDLTQFMRWYNQAGTPLLRVASAWDTNAGTLTLDLAQHCPATPGQSEKQPFVIPVALALIDAYGQEIPLVASADGEGASPRELLSGVFELTQNARRIVLRDVPKKPALSILRGFSAPVRVEFDRDESELMTLLAHDSDMFNRWEAAQTCATRLLVRSVGAIRSGGAPITSDSFADALGKLIEEHANDPAFAAQALALPSESDIAREIGADVDPDAIHAARDALRRAIGVRLAQPINDAYRALSGAKGPYRPDAEGSGRRALRLTLLDLATLADPAAGSELAARLFAEADNMTDKIGALSVLSLIPGDRREAALATFYREFRDDHLVMDKWFALQAMIPEPGALARVQGLMRHELFSMTNPNRLRSLVGSFCANQTQFHAADGAGYRFLAGIVNDLDARNPQVAARLLGALRTWRTMEAQRRSHAEAALRSVAKRTDLSPDVRDIVDRTLA